MGEELIPFKNESQAKKFMEDHFGKKVLKFEELKKEMLFYLTLQCDFIALFVSNK